MRGGWWGGGVKRYRANYSARLRLLLLINGREVASDALGLSRSSAIAAAGGGGGAPNQVSRLFNENDDNSQPRILSAAVSAANSTSLSATFTEN